MYEPNSEREVFFYTSYESHSIDMPLIDADVEYLGADDLDVLDLLTRAATKTSDLYWSEA